MTPPPKITFIDVARTVLEKESKPLSIDEIWEKAEKAGLISQLGTTGKTPKATLGAKVYKQAKDQNIFEKIGSRPAKFVLKRLLKSIPKATLEQISEAPAVATKEMPYSEKDLHPLVVRFAKTRFEARCKTISHEKSVKKGPKHNEWVHPDIVGFTLTAEEWDASVVDLARAAGAPTAMVYSFEIKLSLDFATLRASFFQAVSNCSWAHEGYLVAAKVAGDPDFREELERLSQSFEIGVIELNVDDPDDSEIVYAAHRRRELDWETLNRIASINDDFTEFVASVEKSIKINQVADKGFDRLLEHQQLSEYLKKLTSSSVLPPT